jgi:hypothetical protein
MFSALSTVIIQGFLPLNSGDFLFVGYALTSALSFAFLFLSIVLCIEIISRASEFMYERATFQTGQLKDAIKSTKDMMSVIRGGLVDREKILQGEADIDDEWNRHEKLVFTFLKSRETIHRKAAVIDFEESKNKGSKSIKKSFEQFWNESCRLWGDVSICCFYAGTVQLLLSIMIYMWAQFYYGYDTLTGSTIAVCIIGITLLIGMALLVYLRLTQNPSSFAALNKDYAHLASSSPRKGVQSPTMAVFSDSGAESEVSSVPSLTPLDVKSQEDDSASQSQSPDARHKLRRTSSTPMSALRRLQRWTSMNARDTVFQVISDRDYVRLHALHFCSVSHRICNQIFLRFVYQRYELYPYCYKYRSVNFLFAGHFPKTHRGKGPEEGRK